MSLDAQQVIEMDARWIADKALPAASGGLDRSAWSSDRVRTGIVVGSVQSGKTANMLAMAALSLDRGLDLLVILAGTQVALWLQTYERLLNQLDGTTKETAWERADHRVLVPKPRDVLGDVERAPPKGYLGNCRREVVKAVSAGRPVIIVIPKEDDHLLALSRFLRDAVSDSDLSQRGRPLTMLVLDDEADDASILDARAGDKVTPQFIAAIWSGRPGLTATRHPELLATYIAYTATPQANYLQATHNPLSPRDFHATLRVPADTGALAPRQLTFTERQGLRSYYCGGHLFYERLRGLPGQLCDARAFPIPHDSETPEQYERRFRSVRWQMLGEAMRAYLVAGAVRLLEQGRTLSGVPTGAVPLDDLRRVLPDPHTMLYHPSALKELHFQGAEDIARWSRALAGGEESVILPVDSAGEAVLTIDPAGLALRLDAEEEVWRSWLDRFEASVSALSAVPGARFDSPRAADWATIRKTLIEEVFPHTKLRVLNSDERADDRPAFSPRPGDQLGTFRAPNDVFTIFVAGNVLSRGLTVEGLCTSLFLRSSREPSADTQMQMQRWFGYRGRHLPYCRVFLFADQLELFAAYQRNDDALKQEILAHMEGGAPPFADGVLVLQGDRFRATGKVDSRRVPLHPGPFPTVRLFERGPSPEYEATLDTVGQLLASSTWQPIEEPAGKLRGYIRESTMDLMELAGFLESLRYRVHDPNPNDPLYERWVHVQRTLRLQQPLCRPPGARPAPPVVDPDGCPYTIAAYLRLWDAALRQHDAPGLYPTDNPTMSWNLIDHDQYRRARPRFHVAVRFGAAGATTDPRLTVNGAPIQAMVRRATRPWLLETLWGTRGTTGTYFGDQLFDYHHHGVRPVPRLHAGDGTEWRPRGHPGLLLLHVVRIEGQDVLALGLGIPRGGPDHIAALRGED